MSDVIVQTPGMPRTFSGEKMEVPIKRLLFNTPTERVIHPDAVVNPEALVWYAAYVGPLARQSNAHGEPAPALESWRG